MTRFQPASPSALLNWLDSVPVATRGYKLVERKNPEQFPYITCIGKVTSRTRSPWEEIGREEVSVE
jgi:hypothetical protein